MFLRQMLQKKDKVMLWFKADFHFNTDITVWETVHLPISASLQLTNTTAV